MHKPYHMELTQAGHADQLWRGGDTYLCEGKGIRQGAQLHWKLQRGLGWLQCRNLGCIGCKEAPLPIAHIPERELVSFYAYPSLHSKLIGHT